MLRSRVILILAILTLSMTSCLKRYDPLIDSRDTVKYVVTGQVTKGEQIQYINVSKTAALSDPWYKYKVPVTGCSVIIVDDKSNMYYASDLVDYKKMYEKVKDRLNAENAKVEAEMKKKGIPVPENPNSTKNSDTPQVQ